MLKNYLKTALRNLWRKKGSTLINVIGLSLGIAGSLVLFLIVSRHSTFDHYHSKADRIYRVSHSSKGNDGEGFSAGIQNTLPDAFRNDFSEAEEVVFTSYRSGALVLIPQGSGEPMKKYEENKGVVFTQPGFFRIFDRTTVIGDPIKALDEPNEAVISKTLAKKYFGKEDAIDEIVKYDTLEYKVGAVIDDAPNNTDLPFDLLLSYATIKKQAEKNGGWHSIWSDEHCYMLLKEGESISSIENRIPDFKKKYLDEESAVRDNYILQPLKTIHSDERFGNYNYNTVSPQMLLILSLIAVFLVLTACINFINLATAEAIKRSKEVGIRKSLGSTKGQLVGQFLGETTLVTVASLVIALIIARISLAFLNPFLEENLDLFGNKMLWFYLAGITIVVSLLSGLYPSFVVSNYNPALALKNALGNQSSGYGLRRVLVVVQFCISQVFIIGTIVLVNQMSYLINQDLGFNKDAIINIPISAESPTEDGNGDSKMRTLKLQVEALSGVQQASLNASPPSSGNVSSTSFNIEGRGDEDYATQVKQVDQNYSELFGLKFLAGENIKDLDTAQGFIVNQKFAEQVGYTPDQIIGKTVKMWGKRIPVVGVVNNFNTVSLTEPISPVIMMNRIRGYFNLSVKLNSSNMPATVSEIQKHWEAAYPDAIFSYEFLDEQISNFYDTQKRMSVLVGVFASMAILIGCLGLLGLATFMANQKTKEIGIRKVLGASVQSIFFIFSREFALLILGGFVLAVPIAWYFTSQFLNGFEYKINLGPWVFLAGIGITATIAFVTVGYRSLKAATVNPVDSLKSE